jgi:serine protease AprX
MHEVGRRMREWLGGSLPAYRAVVEAGGRILSVSPTGAVLTCVLPWRALVELARRPDVQAIRPASVMSHLNIGRESASVGAPTWWSAGYAGGRGRHDVAANFSVDQDPVLRSHPAFQGITFETPPGAVEPANPSNTQHGTALLSMAAAQGPAGCSLCQPADAEEKGVAVGVSKVLDPSGAGAETDWAAGVPYYWHDGNDWSLQVPAPDPAQVINYSRGSNASYDDSLTAQTVDATVDDYGVTMTIAAGNSGPAPRSVNDPALAYNALAVGAFTGGGTTDPMDDAVFGWSSRGPTIGGRKKPDLVAVGDGGLADSYYESTGKLWKYDTGTSYAAPQVGGGAILLAGAGIRDPKVVKAVLIDSARPGRATPGSSVGTQTGWLPDWGWGELNLDAAYRERLNFARDEVPAYGARFFRANVQSAGDRATLVWNRRVADCQPLRQGCYYDSDSGFRVYTLSNLDLSEYDASTGALRATSNSTVDNVEQVRASAPGSVVYKVAAGDVDRPPGEPFAIAGTRPLTPLITPQPSTSMTLSTVGTVRPNAPVTVVADVTNPSPDLTAENANVTLKLPAGTELMGGSQTQSLGNLETKGAPGDRAIASWTVRGTTDGVKQLVATTTASRYGSTFSTSAGGSFAVDAVPPRVSIVTPQSPLDGTTIPIAWGATDERSRVASYDLDVAVAGGPFTPWLAATTRTTATYAGVAGRRYKFRVRATDALGNTSQYVTSAEIALLSPTVDPTAANPLPGKSGTASRASPELKVTRLRLKGRRLVVRGVVARGANGKVTAAWAGIDHGRRRGAHASTYARQRSFALVLKLPRPRTSANHGRLTVTYVGDRQFATQSIRLNLRAR